MAGNGRSGAVAILPGSVLGLTSVDNQFWHQDKAGVNDTSEANDEYGSALATGDFDNDGFTDLAIGIPLEGVGALSDAGAVAVMYGGGSGIDSAGDQLWHEDSTGIYGVAAADDQFGFALAVGDSTGDNYDDIVIGIPNQAVGGDAGAGTVALIRGSASGLSATGNQRWHEDRAGTLGTAQPGDHYGYAVSFLDVAGDGLDDLIAGIPGQNFSPADVGAVAVVRGHFSGGFTRYGDQYYHQNVNGVAGDGAQAGDEFGGAL